MKTVLLSLAIILAFANIASATEHPERQVTFMLDNGTVELPLMTFSAPLESIQVFSPELDIALTQYGVVEMGRMFPEFNVEDTTAVAWSGETVRLTDYSRFWYAEVANVTNVQPLVEALALIQGVGCVGTRVLFEEAGAPPNDPNFVQQWGLNNTGQQTGWVTGEDIGWLDAWNIETGGNTKVGIYGAGINVNHAELIGRVYQTESNDVSFHETMIACIIGAATNNALGMAGINGEALIYSRIMGDSGDDGDFINDMVAMRTFGCKVISDSYRWAFTDPEPNEYAPRTLALRDLYMANVLFVAHAGNDGVDVHDYPALSSWATAIGALQYNGFPASFSNGGPKLEVLGPGVDIYSCSNDGSYARDDGTSYAAPAYAGVVSLLLAQHPTLYNDDAKQLIRRTARDKGAAGRDDEYGYGVIDAGAALSKITGPSLISHLSVTGAYDHAVTDVNGQIFYDVPGLSLQPYYGRRHEVRKQITFPQPYETPPWVWGRAVGTVGWNAANPNFGVGYSVPVDGTITTTGCTMKTYVYELDYPEDRWAPVAPAQVKFGISVVGIPDIAPSSVEVTNPWGTEQSYVAGQTVQVRWTVVDNHCEATRSTIYHVVESPSGSSVTQIAINKTVDLLGNGTFFWIIPASTAGSTTSKIRVTTDGVTDLSQGYFSIQAAGGKGGEDPPPDPCDGVCPISSWNGPFVTDLLPFGPNPFRNDTQVRFTLDDTHVVGLRVFDVQGRLVSDLFAGTRQRGMYETRWNGTDDKGRGLPSGVYFVSLKADRKQVTRKVVILR